MARSVRPPVEAPGPPRDRLVLSYLGLRRAVGLIGMALPFTLALGTVLLDGTGLEPSVSDYYHTSMRDVFVGSMCAIAVFLLSYRYDRPDAVAGTVAGVAALGVAFFPTTPGATPETPVGAVHVVCAATFLLTLAWFCLVLFPRTHPHLAPTRRKRQRNVVYRVCGWLIVACVALTGLTFALPGTGPENSALHPVFWLEAAAALAFGVAWFVKGETILTD